MDLVTLGVASLNQTPLDWEGNLERIIRAVESAKSKDVDLLCMPELCLSGYGCEDAFHAPYVSDYCLESLQKLETYSKDIGFCVGLPLFVKDGVYNGCAFLANGKIQGIVLKRYLAGDGVHYEPRWFKPWRGVVEQINIGKSVIPVGSLYFNLGKLKLGVEICEDAWTMDRPLAKYAGVGVNIVFNPSASHFSFGKMNVREQIISESSRSFQGVYCYSNLLGLEAGRMIYDGGVVIAQNGNILSRGSRFSFKESNLVVSQIDLDDVKLVRSRNINYMLDSDHSSLLSELKVNFHYTDKVKSSEEVNDVRGWDSGTYLKEEEFVRSVSLALYDYMRKSYSKGFVLSLSGGLDSATVALLIYHMVVFYKNELGIVSLKKSLNFIPELSKVDSVPEVMNCLLTCAYQATKNSGDVTLNAAKEIAGVVGAKFLAFDVQPMVDSYRDIVENALNRELLWETDDLALQNIQARVRGPGVWFLANTLKALLLTTSNRSEAALGYATMDGDTCGGLCPIGGVDKNFLRKWMLWVRDVGSNGVGAIKGVKVITDQEPTAELRPPDQTQTDEVDLMPYDVLDQIELFAIRDKKSPLEVLQKLRPIFKNRFDLKELTCFVKRFFKLWRINQWKRERYAPSFHLDDQNLDPKTWCRFPILSGNYKKEFAELDKWLKKVEGCD